MMLGEEWWILQVKQKPSTAEETTADIIAWIRGNYSLHDSGIIYCQTRKVSILDD